MRKVKWNRNNIIISDSVFYKKFMYALIRLKHCIVETYLH